MKKMFLFSFLITAKLSMAFAGTVNPVVLKAFKQIFTNAQNIHWKDINDKNIVTFRLNKISVIAIFDESGNLLRTQKMYSKEYLPVQLLNEVKKKFKDMQIYGVTEIISPDYRLFEITLRDEQYWYKVWSDVYANMEIHEKLSRADKEK